LKKLIQTWGKLVSFFLRKILKFSKKTRRGVKIMEAKVELNGFEIIPSIIPDVVYRFRFVPQSEDLDERNREVRSIGVPITPVEDTKVEVVSHRKSLPCSDAELLEEIPFQKLKDFVQEKILIKVLNEKGIKKLLKENLPEREKTYTSYSTLLSIGSFTVRKIKGKFYLFFDLKHRVKWRKSVHQMLKQSKITLEEIKGKRLLYYPPGNSPGKGDLINVEEVIENPSEEERESILKLLEKKYGVTNLPKEFPILKAKFGRKGRIYSFHPDTCYSIKTLSPNKLVISNYKRKEILKETVREIPFLDDTPCNLDGKLFSKPAYVVKALDGTVKKVFSLEKVLNYPPFSVPQYIKEQGGMPFFVLVDKRFNENQVKSFLSSQLKDNYLKLNRVEGYEKLFKTISAGKGKAIFTVDFDDFSLPDKVQEEISKYKFSSALCLIPKMNKEKYDSLKRRLFARNIISQFVIYDEWVRSSNPSNISRTLVYNIYTKLGIRPFSLTEKFNYDLIVGVDCGNDPFNRRTRAGGITVFLSDGTIKGLYPVSIDTGGEKIDNLNWILEIVAEKMDVYGSRVLLLKDGNLYKDEVGSLSESYVVKDRKLKVFTANVKKGHSFRILSDKGKKGVILRNDLAVLLPHSCKGARSILVDSFWEISYGHHSFIPITEELLKTLFLLTKLNFSTIFDDESKLRLPAPIHYSHLYVNALRRNWIIDQYLLEMGALYFL
jgi:argonaute family protein